MDSHNSNSATHQAIHILEYWHKIEFFESTDIKDLEDNADGVLQIEMEALQSLTILPWINPEQVRRAGHRYSPTKKYRYELFSVFLIVRKYSNKHSNPFRQSAILMLKRLAMTGVLAR